MGDKFDEFVSAEDGGEPMRWISVKNKEPNLRDSILMLIPTGVGFVCAGFVLERSLEDGEGEFSEKFLADQYGDDIGYSIECMTHWMPLPQPPKDE